MRRILTTLWLLLACGGPLLAGDGPCGFRLFLRPWLRASDCPPVCGAPDDYCRKPCPALIPVSRCGLPDDYCRKPAPCLLDVSRCGGPDDYCKKSIPCLLCPPVTPYLHHDSVEPCCAPGKRR